MALDRLIRVGLKATVLYHTVCGYRLCSRIEDQYKKKMLVTQKVSLSAINGICALALIPIMIPIDIMRAEIALLKRKDMNSYFKEPIELLGFFKCDE